MLQLGKVDVIAMVLLGHQVVDGARTVQLADTPPQDLSADTTLSLQDKTYITISTTPTVISVCTAACPTGAQSTG